MAADFQGPATAAGASDTVAAVGVEKRIWKLKALRFLNAKRQCPDTVGDGDVVDHAAPRKLHRKKACCAVVRLDNALRVGGGLSLRYFQQPEAVADRNPDPTTWPRLALVRDEGSDMTCAGAFLKRKAMLCFDELIDFNHGEWNCLKGAVKESGLWSHLLVMAVAANLDHGPYSEDRYYETLRGAWRQYLEVADPTTCPLFEEMLPGILRDLRQEHRIGEADIERKIWEELLLHVCLVL